MYFRKIYVKIRKLKNKLFGPIRKKRIKSNFTIISNNCWGGLVYQYFNLQYSTPTVGLFFCADDYIRFCKRFDYYIDQQLQSIKIEESHNRKFIEEHIKLGDYPENVVIGLLDDVEIVFLHYKSFDEAREKWEYRKKRINNTKILFKFNNNNGFCENHYYEWQKLDLPNKLFITDDSRFEGENTVVVRHSLDNDNGVNDTTYYDIDIDLIRLINNINMT